MRIAIVAPPWVAVPPPSYGGTEAVIDALARGLVARGNEVLLCATGDSTCPVPLAWSVPEAVGTADTSVPIEVQHVIGAYEAIEAWGADIVHDHTLIGPLYAERIGVPLVTTNHAPFEGPVAALYRAVSDRVAVIAISEHQASLAVDIKVAAVIHHGIDVDSLPAGAGDGGYALFLGRMSPQKGVHRAAAIARAAGMPLKIAAKAAQPGELDYFRTEVEPLLGPDIEYLGEVGGAAKWDLLRGATCLLNPIQWAEPFGMVMIEAMAVGTPVVATPFGSVPEIVDDGVTGFIRASDAGLTRALAAAATLDRQACRTSARDRFSVQRMVADHLELFRSVIGRSQPLHAA